MLNRMGMMNLSIAFMGTLASTSACAFSKAPVHEEKVPAIVDESPIHEDIDVDNGSQGYELGLRNGGILVQRLQQVTVENQGCSAIGKLENALLKVIRQVKPPESSGIDFSAGFYNGYLDAIQLGLEDSRHICGVRGYDDDGLFAGQLIGSLLCTAVEVDIDILQLLEIDPLYSGWSGGSETVTKGCKTSVELTVRQCMDEDSASNAIDLVLESSCSDF